MSSSGSLPPDMVVGDPMPDVTFEGETGPLRIRDRIGKPLVLYFYVGNEHLLCRAEARAFRDLHDAIVAEGAEVIGVSRDDQRSHAILKAELLLPFTLVSDARSTVGKAWGVVPSIGLFGRVTFVFDMAGICVDRYELLLDTKGQHAARALDVVKRLAAA